MPESASPGPPLSKAVELSGLRLFRCVGSAGGLHRLMFSTLMLFRWLGRGASGVGRAGICAHTQELSLARGQSCWDSVFIHRSNTMYVGKM